jgi:hypothetical protein
MKYDYIMEVNERFVFNYLMAIITARATLDE